MIGIFGLSHLCVSATDENGDSASQLVQLENSPQAMNDVERLPWSCKEILKRDNLGVSGEYNLLTRSGIARVYCEMGLNGGGYTFLSAQTLGRLTDADVQEMFTDKTSFLLRVRNADGTQNYGVLNQLPIYSGYPLVIKKDSVQAGYSHPGYIGLIGAPYLYFSFLPTSPQRDILGIQVNGASVTYEHCGYVMASHFAFFPNFQERYVGPHRHGSSPFLVKLLSKTILNPSCRGLPEPYFMFNEIHFGGCGVFTDTLTMIRQNKITGMAIGFR